MNATRAGSVVRSLPIDGLSGSEVATQVSMREYLRLLLLPRDRELEGELRDRAENARKWYSENGRPFVCAVRVELQNVESTTVFLSVGSQLRSRLLADRLRAGNAFALVILAATAGQEVASHVGRLWKDERPDEAFFLDRFAVAVTEWIVFQASTLFCRASSTQKETLQPHLSPGCGGWDLADQQKLMALLMAGSAESAERKGENMILGPLTLLPSGALHPQHSLLAALGVTDQKYAASPRDLCRSCDLDPCSFRRAPFREGALHTEEVK